MFKTEKQYAHSRDIQSVVFSPDGKTILSGSYDMTLKVWDYITWSRVTHKKFPNDQKEVVWCMLCGFHRLPSLPEEVFDRIVAIVI